MDNSTFAQMIFQKQNIISSVTRVKLQIEDMVTSGPSYFPGNGPCLGYRKPGKPYQWLKYKQVQYTVAIWNIVVKWLKI